MSKLIQVKSTNNKSGVSPWETQECSDSHWDVWTLPEQYSKFSVKVKEKNHNVIIDGSAKLDLKLARLFLQRSADGVSMSTVVFQTPNHTYIGDASEHGL